MRIFIDTLVALMLAGVLAAIIVHYKEQESDERMIQFTRRELSRLQRQIMLQAALEEVQLNEFGYPVTIDPEWFTTNAPENPLLDDMRPWVEVATVTQRTFDHPRDRCAISDSAARFWYNPFKGIVRARVPANVSDVEALRLYNRINGCSLTSLFAHAGEVPFDEKAFLVLTCAND